MERGEKPTIYQTGELGHARGTLAIPQGKRTYREKRLDDQYGIAPEPRSSAPGRTQKPPTTLPEATLPEIIPVGKGVAKVPGGLDRLSGLISTLRETRNNTR